MATTLSNFVQLSKASLVGAAIQAVGTLVAFAANEAKVAAQNGGGTILDKVVVDFSSDGNAKHGAANYALSGTTAQAITLLDLTANTPTSYAGDTTFATWYNLVLVNTGAADVTVAQAASDGARLGLAGTSPTLTVPAGSAVTLASVAGLAVDSTHYGITVTPTSGGSFFIGVSGA